MPCQHDLICCKCGATFVLAQGPTVPLSVTVDGQSVRQSAYVPGPARRPVGAGACGNCGHAVERGVCTHCGSGAPQQRGTVPRQETEPRGGDATEQRFSLLEID